MIIIFLIDSAAGDTVLISLYLQTIARKVNSGTCHSL